MPWVGRSGKAERLPVHIDLQEKLYKLHLCCSGQILDPRLIVDIQMNMSFTCYGVQGFRVFDFPDAALEGICHSHGLLLASQVGLHCFEAVAIWVVRANCHGLKILLQRQSYHVQ